MENQEEVLDVLTLFEKKPSRDIPPVLEDYLSNVAKNGKTLFPWNRLKPLFVSKLEQVMEQLNKDMPYDHLPPFPNVENSKYEDVKKRIIEAVQRFNSAPFTVQRICELVTEPTKHYTRCDKFLRGIEKNVMVVSTVDPFGRKIVSESYRGSLVNGLDINGFNQQKADSSDINDGQPFAPLPLTDWSSNSLASVWPLAMGNGTEGSKQGFSEQRLQGLGSNINQDNSDALEHPIPEEDTCKCGLYVNYIESDTDGKDDTDFTGVNKDISESENDSESKEAKVTSDSVKTVSGSAEVPSAEKDVSVNESKPFNFETNSSGKEEEEEGTENSRKSEETVEKTDIKVDSTSSDSVTQQNNSDDKDESDEPPEKRMKMTNDETEDSVESTSPENDVKEKPLSDDNSVKASEETTEKNTDVEQTSESRTSLPESQQDHTSHDVTENVSSSVSKEAEETASSEVSTSDKVTEETLKTDAKNHTEHIVSDTDSNMHSSTNTETGKIENTGNTGNVDSTSGNSCASEAMETEQVECQTNEDTEEISGTPCEEVDETEPMEQE